MTRLAITADVHADDFGSKIDAATGLNARFLDAIDMLRWVAQDARARECDGLIVAGDLTETRHPAPWRVDAIREALDDFAGPTRILRGNHDGERAGRSIADLLAAGRPGWGGFTRPGTTVIGETAIAMLPYLDAHRLRALPEYASVAPAEAFRILADAFLEIARGLYVEASERGRSTVLIVHQGLAGGLMSDSQAAFLGDQSLVVDTRALGAIGFDAILAGHFHKHQVLSTDPLIAYAGSPYRTDFGEEHQAKGYLVVDVEAGRADMTFVETPARRFVTLDFADGPPILDAISGAIVRAINVEPAAVPDLRRNLETFGAWEVQEIRRARVDAPAIAGGLTEGLTPHEALAAYFAEDPDCAPLVARGRGILEAVS